MDKVSYQALRFDVGNEIANFDFCKSDCDALLNSIMRLFIQASSAQQVRSQRLRRDFFTFRRDTTIKPPSWAFIEPVCVDRLPNLRG